MHFCGHLWAACIPLALVPWPKSLYCPALTLHLVSGRVGLLPHLRFNFEMEVEGEWGQWCDDVGLAG